jgi:hypothetical protein
MVGPCVFPGAGDGAPVDGTSPAKAEPESAHARNKAITKRFMLFSFEVEAMQDCLQLEQHSAERERLAWLCA